MRIGPTDAFTNKPILVFTGGADTDHPSQLDQDIVAWLTDQGAALVGIDSLNIDDMGDRARPVHSTLLGAGIPIVEHLTGLDRLPAGGLRFFAVPAKVAAFSTWPVRAFAIG